ncbi:hypothetical protein D3C76_1746450 [compost metagenome]
MKRFQVVGRDCIECLLCAALWVAIGMTAEQVMIGLAARPEYRQAGAGCLMQH